MDGIQTGPRAGARFWEYLRTPRNLGACPRANASATGVGSCGDKVRFDLYIENNTITEARCRPQGCVYTLVCACAAGALAQGGTIEQALQLQPEDVARELDGLPDDHMHCARLAVNTLGNAIAEFYRRQVAREQGKFHGAASGRGE